MKALIRGTSAVNARANLLLVNLHSHWRPWSDRLRSENGDLREVLGVAAAVVLLVLLVAFGKEVVEFIKHQYEVITS